MTKKITESAVKFAMAIFTLGFSSLANAYCPNSAPYNCDRDPPYPISVGYRLNQGTTIALSSQTPNPVSNLSTAILGISVPRVSATTICQQPGYWVRGWDFQAQRCVTSYFRSSYNYYGSNTTLQPTGTASIQKNGLAVGSVGINNSASNYTFTSPPLQDTGDLNFVAQFTSTSGFGSATSSTVIVTSILDPTVMAAIMDIILE